MKDTLRQLAVIVSVAVTLVVNILANTLPINGQNTGEISDRFQVYFVPAGYVFSIWGVIYLGLIALAVYQALPSGRANPRLRAAGWWIALSGLANVAWIILWHYEQFSLSLVVMLALLACLIIAYLRLEIGRTRVTPGERWAVHLPVSIYLGWITVATVANATALLDYLGWDGFGIAPEVWMWIVLAAVALIATLMNFTRRDVAFTLVILWALAGIAVKHAGVPAVTMAVWITFAVVALTLAAAFFLPAPKRKRLAF
jgi:hypothetical protein